MTTVLTAMVFVASVDYYSWESVGSGDSYEGVFPLSIKKGERWAGKMCGIATEVVMGVLVFCFLPPKMLRLPTSAVLLWFWVTTWHSTAVKFRSWSLLWKWILYFCHFIYVMCDIWKSRYATWRRPTVIHLGIPKVFILYFLFITLDTTNTSKWQIKATSISQGPDEILRLSKRAYLVMTKPGLVHDRLCIRVLLYITSPVVWISWYRMKSANTSISPQVIWESPTFNVSHSKKPELPFINYCCDFTNLVW